jgi:catechol-2,3-dioxygenase
MTNGYNDGDMRSIALFLAGLATGAVLSRQAPLQKGIVEAKLTNVVLTTSKLDLEAAFYEKTFGFKEFYRDKTSVFLKTGSANLVLVRAKSRQAESKQICLDFSVPSLPDAAQKLLDAGVRTDNSDPGILKLNDPDGNWVELVKG